MKIERGVLGTSDPTKHDDSPEYDLTDAEEYHLTDPGEFDLTDATVREHLRTELHLAIEELLDEGKINSDSENKFVLSNDDNS